MNKTQKIGNLTRNPVLKDLDNGKKVVNFSIAVNDSYKPDADPLYFKCEAWNKTAEYVNNHLTQGDKILVEGSDKGLEVWIDKTDGTPRGQAVISVREVYPIFVKKWNDKSGNTEQGGQDEDASVNSPPANKIPDNPRF